MARILHLATTLVICALCVCSMSARGAQIGPTKFDHLTTGFELLGAHLNVPCESCHVGAIFKGTSRDCASCHSRGSRVSATVKPQNHVLSTDRCDACHTLVAWKPASHFDHQEVQGSCATCHDGVIAQGKSPTHIASTMECAACHSVFGWKPVITVDHTQVNGSCTNCHDGKTATGKPGNHIPTTDSCDNCHSTFAWKPANVKHVGNISNCAGCHNGTIATGKTPTHMTTSDACGACHSVVVWKPQITVDHTQVSGTCYSCHNGKIATGKPSNHPATDNTCENCHVTTAFKPANVNHNGITSNCVSCHNGKTATGKPTNHINTSDSCQACHSVLVWKPQVTVDHTQVLGTCASCHNGKIALGRAANHIPANADCGVCHLSTVVFGPGTLMNHTGITSNCSACHETAKSWLGVTIVTRPTAAQDKNHPTSGDCSQCHASTVSFTVDVSGGKPVNHIPTTQACSICHADSGDFAIYKMNHTGITNNCAQCHGKGLSFANIVPKEPPANHIPTTTACEACHSPTNFTAFGPNNPMSHTGISSGCQTCHETGMTWFGVTMVDRPTPAQDKLHPTTGDCAQCHSSTTSFSVVTAGKPSNHIPTIQACTLCHSNPNDFSVYKMDHTGITNNCSQCHAAGLSFANIVPKAPPSNHFPVAGLACENCHSPTNFGAFGPGTAMSHTGITGNCASCHETGMTWYGVTMVDRPTAAQDASHPKTGECSNCHNSTVSFSGGVTSGGKPSNHIPTTQACTLCHSNSKDYSVYKMDHTGITNNCAQCHAAGLTFANITPKEPPANHLPIGTLACENCHSPTVFTAFGPGTPMSHTGITKNCAGCHETGMSWLGVTMVDRPTAAQDKNHPTTGDCSQCHSSTVSFTTGLAKPANHIPTTQPCTLCHTNPNDYTVYKMDHTGITGNCAQCHATGSSFANIVPKSPPTGHIPVTGLACENCHSKTNFTAFGPGTPMSHTGITSNCASCHETGMAWLGVTMVDRPTAAQDANHPKTGDCSQCHTSTVNFSQGISNKPANHIPTVQVCTLCHTNPNDYSVYKMDHTGIANNCAQCHAAGLTFANITPKAPPSNHLPIAGAACENCHAPNVFTAFGPGTPMSHTGITSNCASCHETGMAWLGVTMVDRPTAAQDANHPTTGDCSQCHSSTVSFTTGLAKPANHIPTTQACTLCHTNAANYAVYTMSHSGITNNCAQCHATGSSFANIVPKAPPSNHLPLLGRACEACHSPSTFTAFGPGTAMNHTGVTTNCASCHETGMTWFGVTMVDRPTAAQDANHPKTGDCSQCHSSTVNFTQGVSAKPPNHIPTVQACTLCHSNPNDYSVYKMDHTGITTNCAQCHAAGLTFANITPKEPPANHLPINGIACESCHSAAVFTAFGPGTAMNHSGITTNCASCHETGKAWFGVTMVDRPTAAQDANHPTTGECSNCHSSTVSFTAGLAKPSNHIPTTQPCTLCHTNAGNYAVYTMSHSGITNNCAQCHAAGLTFANITPKEPPSNHLPIAGRACENCHAATVFSSFVGTKMNHTGITTGCASCHETGMTWFGVTMVDRPTAAQDKNHPTTGECSNCHSSTVSFTTGVSTKPANHIPTAQPCTLCHSNPNDYSVFAMSHSGITTNCIQCHGSGLSFANIVPKEPPSNHIPTGSIACESCHSTTNFTAFSGTAMVHSASITALTCVTCHETGMAWFGVKMVDRPKGHHGTTDCKGCHNTTSFNGGNAAALKTIAKTATAAKTVTGTAAAGTTAAATLAASERLGKGDTGLSAHGTATQMAAQPGRFNLAGRMSRLASVNDAGVASGAKAASLNAGGSSLTGFNHAGARRDCMTCHNGLVAVGKSARHIPSNNSCDNCHTVNAWTPARFEHLGVTLSCSQCHDSVHATGRPTNHVQTAIACNTCHSTVAWLPVIFRHSGITMSCQSCHNGAGASGKPLSHMTITSGLDCSSCHNNTTAWTPVLYRHTSPRYPGEHRVELTCNQCHKSNTDQIPWTSPANAPACAACHERNYTPQPHTKFGTVKYTASELKNCAGACHIYSDATQKAVIKLRPGPQHQVSSGQF